MTTEKISLFGTIIFSRIYTKSIIEIGSRGCLMLNATSVMYLHNIPVETIIFSLTLDSHEVWLENLIHVWRDDRHTDTHTINATDNTLVRPIENNYYSDMLYLSTVVQVTHSQTFDKKTKFLRLRNFFRPKSDLTQCFIYYFFITVPS